MTSRDIKQMWSDYWTEGESRWHLKKPNNILTRYLSLLTGGLAPEEAGSILVPLSGKTMDIKYLYDKGYSVVAVEMCEDVIKQFLQEHKITCSRETLEGFGYSYVTEDTRLKFLCGDIFKVTPKLIGHPISMIWDRAAIVAIEKEDLPRYADVLKGLLYPGGRYLLVTVHYDQLSHTGPPYDVPPELLRSLFDENFKIELVATVDEGESLKTYLAIPDKELVFLLIGK